MTLLLGALCLAFAWFLLRVWMGSPAAVTRRVELWVLRGACLAVLLAIFLNPVKVQQSPGPLERPEVFVLLDSSQSMTMGTPRTRWDESLDLLRSATGPQGDTEHARVSPFRFGHRLTAIPPGAIWPQAASEKPAADFGPLDPDTQLAGALRRLSSRFGRTPPAGVVLFSDGQARDAAEVERMARGLGTLKVPVHVLPVGDTAQGGDVAIVGVVAPERVRKYSQVDVHVFLRSFGFDGQRVELALYPADDTQGKPVAPPLPLTLKSGIQSATIPFQSDIQSRRLKVMLKPLPNEMSIENNHFAVNVDVDRTKIRVLYIEGNAIQLIPVQRGDKYEVRGPHSDLQEVLSEDPDIECVVLAPGGINGFRRVSVDAGVADRGFPETVAELAAFDAILLSNIRADAFSETQLQWIEQWIGERGAGLMMVGGPSSFSSGGWQGSLLEPVLPVTLAESADWVSVSEANLRPGAGAAGHSIWRVSSDERENIGIVSTIPAFAGMNQGLKPKATLSTVLATMQASDASPEPGLVVGKYGKGRTAALSAPVTTPWATEFISRWGSGDRRFYGKFWRNVVYWMTENSSVGRRRLMAAADKRFYRPGETVGLSALAFDERASRTKDYRIEAMIEPMGDLPDDPNNPAAQYAPVRWPSNITRDSGEDAAGIIWGETFTLLAPQKPEDGYRIALPIFDVLPAGSATQALRLELTAYEDQTQVDSTSLVIQILHDPFELQNPLPNHELLERVAKASGGEVLRDPEALKSLLNSYPVKASAPIVRKSPLWSQGWLAGTLIVLLTAEWLLRRRVGMA